MSQIDDSGEGFLRRFAGAAHMERMGRMNGWALRGVLAMMDGETDVLEAVLGLMADFDDQPGRPPMPAGYNRWEFATKQVEALADQWMAVADHVGVSIFFPALMSGTRATLNRHAPAGRRQAALDLLDRAVDADRDGGRANNPYSPELLLYYTALCAWLANNKKLFPAQQLVRLELTTRIRDVEAAAIGVPEAERISEVSDRDAIDFLAWMYDEHFAGQIPTDPAERNLAELDIIAAVKAHLLEVGGPESTTAQQKAALNNMFIRIFRGGISASAARGQDRGGRPAPMRRPSGKGKKKGKKKGKGQSGRAPKAAAPRADVGDGFQYLDLIAAAGKQQEEDGDAPAASADADQKVWQGAMWFGQVMTRWHCAIEPETWLRVAKTVPSKEHINNMVIMLRVTAGATILGLIRTLALEQRREDVLGLDFAVLADITARRDAQEIVGMLEALLPGYPTDSVPMGMAKSFTENMVKWNRPQATDDEKATVAATLELADLVCQSNAALVPGPGPRPLEQRMEALGDWYDSRDEQPDPFQLRFGATDDD